MNVIWSKSPQWCLERMGLAPLRVSPVPKVNLEAMLSQHVPDYLRTVLDDYQRPGMINEGLLWAEGGKKAPDRGRSYGWASEGETWLGQF